MSVIGCIAQCCKTCPVNRNIWCSPEHKYTLERLPNTFVPISDGAPWFPGALSSSLPCLLVKSGPGQSLLMSRCWVWLLMGLLSTQLVGVFYPDTPPPEVERDWCWDQTHWCWTINWFLCTRRESHDLHSPLNTPINNMMMMMMNIVKSYCWWQEPADELKTWENKSASV